MNRKGQFFIIGAIIMVISLFLINSYIRETIIYKPIIEEQASLFFLNVRRAAIDTVEIYSNREISTDSCDVTGGQSIGVNLERLKTEVQNIATEMNYDIIFEYEINYDQNGEAQSVTFNIRLVSGGIILEDHFTVTID